MIARYHDDRYQWVRTIGGGAHQMHEVEAVQRLHGRVGDDDVGRKVAHQFKGFRAVGGHLNLFKLHGAQNGAVEIAHEQVVLDNEEVDAPEIEICHRCRSPLRSDGCARFRLRECAEYTLKVY